MPIFRYQAKDKNAKDIKGYIEAKDQKQAKTILKEKGLFCYSVAEKTSDPVNAIFKKYFLKPNLSDLVAFTRQLATMVNAGLPLTESLSILNTQSSNRLSDIAGEVLRDVKGGASLADAMEKHPKIFSPVYVGLIRAGESAGVLDNIMLRLADNLENQKEFNAKITGAMIYPVIILVGMGAVMVLMVIFVIPKLTSLYSEFDAELPMATKILMSIANISSSFWWIFIIIIAGLVYLFKMINSTRPGKKRIDSFKFKIPIIGNLLKQIIFTEFSRTLGLLVGVGVSIINALEITAKVNDNIVVQDAIAQVNKQVEKGISLASATLQSDVFPQILSQMLAVGEETGKMDEVLLKVSKYFQSESEQALKTLTTAIEPIIMVVLGIGVAFLLIAVIMPIYTLTSSFK